jgi:hypothetical protein
MATISQLLKLQQTIIEAEKKIDIKKQRRRKLVQELSLKEPYRYESRAENFVAIDGYPHRLWVYSNGDLMLEEIKV